jgi:hypothetical protein
MRIITTIIALFFLAGLQAQESSNAAGGEATGTGGKVSYSVGQLFYTSATGTNGSVGQGVQQPYEISVTTGINETSINLKMSVYPNPTIDYLTLQAEEMDNLNYQLFDMQGKVIENKMVLKSNTTINMETLPKAIYFLKVTRENQIVKTFKIIKN